jgi:hypothetical protein
MQGRGRGTVTPPTGIAYDSDFGNNIDSLLTLAFLKAIAAKGEARLIVTSISKSNLKAAQAVDAIDGFYSPAPAGGGRGFGGGVGVGGGVIGLADSGKLKNDTPVIDAVVGRKSADGKPEFPYKIESLIDTGPCGVTIRNMLLAQNDLNAIMLVDGPLTDAVETMDLYGARPQITAKVKELVVAAGSFPNGAPDPKITADLAATKKLLAEWPTPIVFVGSEVGESVPYPGSSIASDFSWSTNHPIVDAYKAFKPMPYDAPAPGLAAALYAAHPNDGYFKLSEPGTVTVADNGQLKFTPGAGGKHRYLIAEPDQKEKITKLYTELISTKPVAPVFAGRGGRGGRGASGAGGRGFIGGRGASGAVAITPAAAAQQKQ